MKTSEEDEEEIKLVTTSTTASSVSDSPCILRRTPFAASSVVGTRDCGGNSNNVNNNDIDSSNKGSNDRNESAISSNNGDVNSGDEQSSKGENKMRELTSTPLASNRRICDGCHGDNSDGDGNKGGLNNGSGGDNDGRGGRLQIKNGPTTAIHTSTPANATDHTDNTPSAQNDHTTNNTHTATHTNTTASTNTTATHHESTATDGTQRERASRQLYTPAHFTLSKNPHLHYYGREVFSPNTIRMTDSLDRLLRDDDDDVVGGGVGGADVGAGGGDGGVSGGYGNVNNQEVAKVVVSGVGGAAGAASGNSGRTTPATRKKRPKNATLHTPKPQRFYHNNFTASGAFHHYHGAGHAGADTAFHSVGGHNVFDGSHYGGVYFTPLMPDGMSVPSPTVPTDYPHQMASPLTVPHGGVASPLTVPHHMASPLTLHMGVGHMASPLTVPHHIGSPLTVPHMSYPHMEHYGVISPTEFSGHQWHPGRGEYTQGHGELSMGHGNAEYSVHGHTSEYPPQQPHGSEYQPQHGNEYQQSHGSKYHQANEYQIQPGQQPHACEYPTQAHGNEYQHQANEFPPINEYAPYHHVVPFDHHHGGVEYPYPSNQGSSPFNSIDAFGVGGGVSAASGMSGPGIGGVSGSSANASTGVVGNTGFSSLKAANIAPLSKKLSPRKLSQQSSREEKMNYSVTGNYYPMLQSYDRSPQERGYEKSGYEKSSTGNYEQSPNGSYKYDVSNNNSLNNYERRQGSNNVHNEGLSPVRPYGESKSRQLQKKEELGRKQEHQSHQQHASWFAPDNNRISSGVYPYSGAGDKQQQQVKKKERQTKFHPKGQGQHKSIGQVANVQEFVESPSERAAFKEFGRQFRQQQSLSAAKSFALSTLSKSNNSSSPIYLPPSTHWRVYLELADIAKRSNEFENARNYYRKACQLQPLASQGWMEYSKLEEEGGNLKRCADILEEGLGYCGANENLLIRAVKFRERIGQLDQARQLLGRLKYLSIEKYWKVMMEGALLEARAGNYMTVAREILKYLTHYVSWYGPLYLAHTKLERDYGSVSDAFAIVEKGLKELPRYGPLYFQAFCLLEKEDLSRNSYNLPRTMAMVSRADNISKELLWKVHLEAAQIQERAAAQQVRNNSKLVLTECLDATRKSYSKAMALCPPNLCWKIWLASGRTEVSCGNISVARTLFLRAYESVSEKGRSTVLLECARLEELCSDVQLARVILCKARVEFGKSDWKVWLASVNLECRCGLTDRAIDFAIASLKIHSGTGRLWASLIQLCHAYGEIQQIKILKYALQAVPKSGEVWCEGARIFLNPFCPTFDLQAAARHLSFAKKFTPQYGDSFTEQVRLDLIDQCLIPIAEPFISRLHTSFLSRDKMSLADAYCFISEQVKHVADVVKTQLSYDKTEFLKALDTSELELQCSSADPNYGHVWFQCRNSPIDTAWEVIDRAKSMLASDIVQYSFVYVAAIVRRAAILLLVHHHKEMILPTTDSEDRLQDMHVFNPNERDNTMNTQLRKAPSLNEMLWGNKQEDNVSNLSSQMFVTAHVESNKDWSQLSSTDKQRMLFGSDSLLS